MRAVLLIAITILCISGTTVFGQELVDAAPNPYGASPMIMYAQAHGDRGIRFSTHSAVWKYARSTDGYIGYPGSKVTDWTMLMSSVRGSTLSGLPVSEQSLRTKLASKTLVVVSLGKGDVAPEFLKILNQDALILNIEDIKEIRKLLKIIGAEFEPGTEETAVTKR